MRPRIVRAAIAAAIVLGVAACSGPATPAMTLSPAPATATRAVGHASGAATAQPTPTLRAQDAPMDDDGEQTGASPSAPPVWDDASRAAALNAASAAIALWARPGVDGTTWWHDLSPTLSAGAREAYVGTDPASIPVHNPGPGTLTDTSSVYLATVAFSTDAGAWTVLLSRQASGAWLVERITPAQVTP